MNSIPTFVASTTLSDAEWNATIIRDVSADVPRLKQQHDLLVMGSGRLVHALREHDLVDEYEAWIHPILLGAGKRLFEESTGMTTLALRETKTSANGITVLTFRSRTLTSGGARSGRAPLPISARACEPQRDLISRA
jgi:dihydrofolate reductase